MALPIIGEIWDGIRSGIDWTLKLMPRPVLYFIFIFLVTIIANFMAPIFFNLFGIFCLDGQRVQGSGFDVANNIGFTLKVFSVADNVNGTPVEPFCINTYSVPNGTVQYYYDGRFCTNCSVQTNSTAAGYGKCIANAWPIPYASKTILQKWQCENIYDTGLLSFGCEPPPGFRYDHDTNNYICEDTYLCGNLTPTDSLRRDFLNKGYVFSPPEDIAGSNVDWVGAKCVGNKPKFAVGGIEIFNPVLWLLITVMGILWWVYRHTQGH